jgi:acyl-CoA hydrolase
VPTLRPGAGVVTTRAHVRFIITENGAVDLYGKTLNERAQLLISIAHPEDQEGLELAWYEARV